jgi:hypothetical protein
MQSSQLLEVVCEILKSKELQNENRMASVPAVYSLRRNHAHCLVCKIYIDLVFVRSLSSIYFFTFTVDGVCKAILLQAWTGPEGSRRLRLPDLKINQHMKVVRLSALCTSCLYSRGNIPGIHFC